MIIWANATQRLLDPILSRKFTPVFTPVLEKDMLEENHTPNTSYFEISENLCKTEHSDQVVIQKPQHSHRAKQGRAGEGDSPFLN